MTNNYADRILCFVVGALVGLPIALALVYWFFDLEATYLFIVVPAITGAIGFLMGPAGMKVIWEMLKALLPH